MYINREDIAAIHTLVVHDGIFHADDVGCFAVMRILIPELNLIRSRKIQNETPEFLIADVGGGRYDHHQTSTKIREKDGVKNCAQSLIWDDFGPFIIEKMAKLAVGSKENDSACAQVYKSLIRTIAMEDNGKAVNKQFHPFTISTVISGFNPTWLESNDADSAMNAFMQAADVFTTLFQHEVNRIVSSMLAHDETAAAAKEAEDKGSSIVVLKRFASWQGSVCASKTAKLVIYPALTGNYNVQTVPVQPGSFVSRIRIPESWCLAPNDPGAVVIPGLKFAHPAGFLAGFADQESAIAAAKLLVNEQ